MWSGILWVMQHGFIRNKVCADNKVFCAVKDDEYIFIIIF